MTQSRAALLEVAVFAIVIAMLRPRASPRASWQVCAATCLVLIAFWFAWPGVNQTMLLQPGRALQGQAELGVRRIHWMTMLDAVGRRPIVGYGWNQASVAQSRAADAHEASHEFVEHSHNVVIDLLVWNGIPVGAAIVGSLAWWLWWQARACRTGLHAIALTALAVVITHGLLEFPLEYAYFLLPVGLLMGAMEATAPAGPGLTLSAGSTSPDRLVARRASRGRGFRLPRHRREQSHIAIRDGRHRARRACERIA